MVIIGAIKRLIRIKTRIAKLYGADTQAGDNITRITCGSRDAIGPGSLCVQSSQAGYDVGLMGSRCDGAAVALPGRCVDLPGLGNQAIGRNPGRSTVPNVWRPRNKQRAGVQYDGTASRIIDAAHRGRS